MPSDPLARGAGAERVAPLGDVAVDEEERRVVEELPREVEEEIERARRDRSPSRPPRLAASTVMRPRRRRGARGPAVTSRCEQARAHLARPARPGGAAGRGGRHAPARPGRRERRKGRDLRRRRRRGRASGNGRWSRWRRGRRRSDRRPCGCGGTASPEGGGPAACGGAAGKPASVMRCPGTFGARRRATRQSVDVVVRCLGPAVRSARPRRLGHLGTAPSGGGIEPTSGESPPSRAMSAASAARAARRTRARWPAAPAPSARRAARCACRARTRAAPRARAASARPPPAPAAVASTRAAPRPLQPPSRGGTRRRTSSGVRGSSPAGAAREAHRLGEQPRQHPLVDARDLEQVRHEIAAVDHLPGEGLFDLTHGRDLALDDEGAQGHGPRDRRFQ